MNRIISITRNGRFVALRRPGGLDLVDVLGTAPRRHIQAAADAPFTCVGAELWVVEDMLHRFRTTRVDPAIASELPGDDQITSVSPGCGSEAISAIASGSRSWWIESGPAVTVRELEDGWRWFAMHGRRVAAVRPDRAELRTIGRDDVIALPEPGGDVRAAVALFGGRAIAMWVRNEETDALLVASATGAMVHRITVPHLQACAFAESAGLAITAVDDELSVMDLRYGHVRTSGPAPHVVLELAADAEARRVIIAGPPDEETPAIITLSEYHELFRGKSAAMSAPAHATNEAPSTMDPFKDLSDLGVEPAALDVASRHPTAPPDSLEHASDREVRANEQSSSASRNSDRRAPYSSTSEASAIPRPVPLALDPIMPAARPAAPEGAVPFERPGDHLAALLDLVAARAAVAIADGWHSGRISRDVEGGLPYEHEVRGLAGDVVGLAADALNQARARLAERSETVRVRTLASLASGMALPFVELAREFSLSPHETQLLFCAAAPRLRAEVARLYGVLAGQAGRSACDTFIAELLVAETADDRDQIAHELAADAPLIRSGLIRWEPGPERVALVVDDVLLDRLRGHDRAIEISTAAVRRVADRELTLIRAPAAVLRELVVVLAERHPDRPARIVLRGRRGTGRHTIAAALAAQASRSIAAIDAARLPRAGTALANALRTELVRARIARAVPVVSGLENIEASDAETRHLVRQVLADHRGPLFVRTTPEGDVPLDPEHVAVTLPQLSLGERTAAWTEALTRHSLDADPALDAGALATRFRFGPGTIERICDDVARRVRAGGAPAVMPVINAVGRQHIAVRLGKVATRVERLPDWGQVTLPDDMRDSVRALIGRMQHQCTVFEDWGYDRHITTSRGLTALFYGPPGTGKTLVAGLIARELGLELWRIDLARVMSKWLGETEKNLAVVFDVAEEGEVMLLFDEADSLFAKRTAVKTSNDRYANLEVNYLLQRLDSFEGVAVLTTNLEGSIDNAFKRRLSMQLYFSFPDEDLRAELWAAHVPLKMPCAGELDFADLARRFPLSGGYIRNSVLRAAFLAAQERRPLAQDHLIRAVQLEYLELGRLAVTGRME